MSLISQVEKLSSSTKLVDHLQALYRNFPLELRVAAFSQIAQVVTELEKLGLSKEEIASIYHYHVGMITNPEEFVIQDQLSEVAGPHLYLHQLISALPVTSAMRMREILQELKPETDKAVLTAADIVRHLLNNGFSPSYVHLLIALELKELA